MAGGVSIAQIYTALINAGASTTQAIGIMANMKNESGFDPEEQVIDSNGLPSSGLVQENGTQYTGLVTGNPVADMNAQIRTIAQNGGFAAATGPTPQAAAGNFAANYERCVGCQPGGDQYNSRVSNADTVAAWVTTGNWPQSSGVGVASTASSTGSECLISLPGAGIPIIGSSVPCLLSKSEARGIVGGMLLTAGAFLGLVGVLILAAYAFERSGAGRVANRALQYIPAAEIVSGGITAVQGPGRVISDSRGRGPARQRKPRQPEYQGAHARKTPTKEAATADRYARSGRPQQYQGRHRRTS